MSLDVSPVRPWEWGDIDSYEWTLATAIQQVVKEGVQAAREQLRQAEARSKEMDELAAKAAKNARGA